MNVPFHVKFLIVTIGIAPWFVGAVATAFCPMTKINPSACPEPSTTTKCEDAKNAMDCGTAYEDVKEIDAFSCRSSAAQEECVDAVDITWCYTHYTCTWNGADCEVNPASGLKYYHNYKQTENCPKNGP